MSAAKPLSDLHTWMYRLARANVEANAAVVTRIPADVSHPFTQGDGIQRAVIDADTTGYAASVVDNRF